MSPPTPGFLYYEETYGSLSADQATTNWYDQAGVFYNNPQGAYIDNISLSGSQAAYMYDTPGLQLSQTLSSTFQVGKSYQLTVALAGGNQTAPMPLNDPIDIGLYYMSGGSQTLIGTPTTVLNDDSGWNGYYIYQLNDYSLTIPAVGAAIPGQARTSVSRCSSPIMPMGPALLGRRQRASDGGCPGTGFHDVACCSRFGFIRATETMVVGKAAQCGRRLTGG